MILSDGEVRAMSALALAHMGDAVYEILARREVCRSGKLTAGELHVGLWAAAKPDAVGAVGKQHFTTLNRHHRHRRVQAFQHRGEALVRRCELVTHPLGFGDVGDGGHPAGLVTLCVDQGGDVHARIELAAVASLHVEFNAPCGASTQQFLLEHAVEFFIDKNLSRCKSMGIHPLENTATVFISFKDLDKFLWNLDVDVVKIKL